MHGRWQSTVSAADAASAPLRISIVTVCLNAAETVGATLESIRAENDPNLQHVVKDGGSTDGTLEILERHRSQVSVLESRSDRGISDAFNQGIDLCDGELIGIVSADDCLPRGSLSSVRAAARTWPEASVLFGDAIVVDGKRRYRVAPGGAVEKLAYQQVLLHASTWVRRAAYQRWGTFREDFHLAMDYELLLRFYRAGAQFRYFPEVLGGYSTGGVNTQQRLTAMREVARIAKLHGGSAAVAEGLFLSKLVKHVVKTASPRLLMEPALHLYRRARGRHRPVV